MNIESLFHNEHIVANGQNSEQTNQFDVWKTAIIIKLPQQISLPQFSMTLTIQFNQTRANAGTKLLQ